MKSALSALHRVPDRPFQPLNLSQFPRDHYRGAVIVEYCLLSGPRFTHEWGEEMHAKSLSQGLNVDLAQPGLEPGTF